jgi:glycosyltransferase involved in cell wall biosynthesis
MVSTEYPPMHGGVGRYTEKLVASLRKKGIEVLVVCNKYGQGDFSGLSPCNKKNSSVLTRLSKEVNPDLIHVQYEQGMYGIHLDPINPLRTKTSIEEFYEKCNIPIVTTFHSAYTFRQWMKLIVSIHDTKFGKLGSYARKIYDYWTHLINYNSFCQLNKKKLGPKRAGIVFSKYLANLIPGTQVIYHGSETAVINPPDKQEIKKLFSIPTDKRIALASGFATATKGWDIIEKMHVPSNWRIVVNSSKNHYNKELDQSKIHNQDVIQINKGFLSEKHLSLLLHCADALILPYKVSSGSGVMFDGFAHNLPFVSSDIGFFREFSSLGLGLSVKRKPSYFSNALLELEQKMEKYKKSVQEFSTKLTWSEVANQHIHLYENVRENTITHNIKVQRSIPKHIE